MAQPKLTRVHIGLGFDEIGVQYEADDGAGGTTTQKGFVALPPGTTDAVWAAAQIALAAQYAAFPPDMPIGEVATALRMKRDAEAAAKVAIEQKQEAEEQRAAAERARTEAERAKAKAENILTATIADAGEVAARKAADEAQLADWMAKRSAAKAEATEAALAAEAAKREAANAETARRQAAAEMAAAMAAVEEARATKAALDAEIATAKATRSAEAEPAKP